MGRVVVVGAGPAGLAAARHLQRQGVEVVVVEGRRVRMIDPYLTFSSLCIIIPRIHLRALDAAVSCVRGVICFVFVHLTVNRSPFLHRMCMCIR